MSTIQYSKPSHVLVRSLTGPSNYEMASTSQCRGLPHPCQCELTPLMVFVRISYTSGRARMSALTRGEAVFMTRSRERRPAYHQRLRMPAVRRSALTVQTRGDVTRDVTAMADAIKAVDRLAIERDFVGVFDLSQFEHMLTSARSQLERSPVLGNP
jgi:hypothetical protein